MPKIDLNKLIKENYADPILSVMAKEDKKLREQIASLGTWAGSSDTIAGMPTVDLAGRPISSGDTATLTTQDGDNSIGLYRFDGTEWKLEIDYSNLDIGNIIKEAKSQGLIKDNLLKDNKFVTPKQVAEYTSEAYHPKQGDENLTVVGKDAEEGTQEFVTANQLSLTYTEAEAQAKYDSL
jgi:hypothetical protein